MSQGSLLSASVAFAEEVDGVQLRHMLYGAFCELLGRHFLEKILVLERRKPFHQFVGDELLAAEHVGLGYIDRPQFPRPVAHVPKDMRVEVLIAFRGQCDLGRAAIDPGDEIAMPFLRQHPLDFLQSAGIADAEFVSEDARAGIATRVVHRGALWFGR